LTARRGLDRRRSHRIVAPCAPSASASSYFQVGLRYQIALAGDKLEVGVRDRFVEVADASRPFELALWLKQLILGSVDSSYRAAAHTRLTVGGRHFEARVVGAAVSGDDLGFALGFAASP